jgi:hypothetical protein
MAEEAGFPTISMGNAADRMAHIKPPRALLVKFARGSMFGEPGKRETPEAHSSGCAGSLEDHDQTRNGSRASVSMEEAGSGVTKDFEDSFDMNIPVLLLVAIFLISLVLTMVGLGGGLVFSPLFVILGIAEGRGGFRLIVSEPRRLPEPRHTPTPERSWWIFHCPSR